MRLKNEIKELGYFWLPNSPEKKVFGTLLISNGGNIELETMGLFDESIDGLNKLLNTSDPIERIVGQTEGHGLVTLDDCFYKTKNISFGGVSKTIIYVGMVLFKASYDEGEKVNFNTYRFSIEGIDEWLGISGIKVDSQFTGRTSTITYKPPEDISIDISNGMKLIITFTCTLPFFSPLNKAKVTQKAYFKLVSEEERPIDEFISLTYKIITLLSFAVDQMVCIERVSATLDSFLQNNSNGKGNPVSIPIYYRSLPFVKESTKIDKDLMLFRYDHIRDNAELIFNNWFNAYESIDPALNLYFTMKTGAHKYLEGKFLALVQGLETYHRRTSSKKLMADEDYQQLMQSIVEKCPIESKDWLIGRLCHGNEISLSQRIKAIIEPFKMLVGTSKERSRLIRHIVNARNYLTHYDKSLEAEEYDLWVLCQRMEAIFQLHLLKVVGFSNDEVISIFKNSDKLQFKLK